MQRRKKNRKVPVEGAVPKETVEDQKGQKEMWIIDVRTNITGSGQRVF